MKPMNWMIIYFMFNILIFLMNLILYFYKNNNLMNFKSFNKNNMYWKW